MKIGFIGLGLMGKPMSLNILKKLDQGIMVYDVDKNKMNALVKEGAVAANSIKELGENCDVVISMVPKSEHVESVYAELLTVAKPGHIFIDMSTISPNTSMKLSKMVAEKGATMLDAPVVKSVPAAEAGVLGIYIGGDKATYEKIKYILDTMGNNTIHMGENGSGLVMKLCHNTLVTEIQNGVNEMITISQKCGIDTNDFIEAISYGGAKSFYLDSKGQAIIDGNYATAFSVENMHKDVHLMKTLEKEMGLELPGVQVAVNVYDKAMEEGYGPEDFCATIKTVRGN